MTGEQALERIRELARAAATALQARADGMTGTELYAEKGYIPDFAAAKEKESMLSREAGFVCRTTAGRIVRLLQPYDSTVYPNEPEELPAQWGFKWSTNPEDALEFVAIATSPYGTNECCLFGGRTYKSTIDGNVWSPADYPSGWTEV